MARITITTQEDNMPLVQAWTNSIKKVKLYVGVTEETDARDSGRIGNIALAGILENGAPSMNIPPRPFMKPGIESIRSEAKSIMKRAAEELYKKNTSSARELMESLGQKSVEAIQGVIGSNVPPALDQATIKKRKRSGVMGTGTLVKTGQLRNSISYKVQGI